MTSDQHPSDRDPAGERDEEQARRDAAERPDEPDQQDGQAEDDDEDQPRVIVTGPGGLGIAEQGGEKKRKDPTADVEEPAKVMRLGSMIKQLLEEVREAPLDDAARDRLARIHEQSLKELESGLSEELAAELHRIALPFDENTTPSDAELRIAKAQLVGWLEGLFHGIQTALVAQQMAAQSQLSQMRKALPAGAPGQVPPGLVVNRGRDDSDRPSPGQYL